GGHEQRGEDGEARLHCASVRTPFLPRPGRLRPGTMKLIYTLIFLSVGVMSVMVFQTVDREFKLHGVKTGLVKTSDEVKRKEDEISELKNKVRGLKQTLATVNVKLDELRMKQELALKTTKEHEDKLQACNKRKDDKQSTCEQEHVAKAKAQQEIQSLKQQILDRDKAICAFADTAKEQAR
uniref:Uncharacterized protein n=1 Tax=Salarias fasciatus TaxID=181472 RepID=A0A672J190_SALFA